MNIPGHVAVALAQHHFLSPAYLPENEPIYLRTLLLASLFPDMVDKSIGYVFRFMPNGRHYAHNIFSLVGLSLAVSLIWGRQVGLAWFVGYLGHLLADSGNRVPWLFPAMTYKFYKGKLNFELTQLIREGLFLTLVLLVRWASRK